MGGKRRPTISQLEKRLTKELEEKLAKREEPSKAKLKVTSQGELTQASLDAVYRELAKLSVITPYQLSTMFNLKLSVAKHVLRTLEAQGLVKLVAANRRVQIYVPAGA